MDLAKYFPEFSNDETKLNELIEYKRDLDIISDSDISIQFNNKGKYHATLVMSKIFETADDHIKIFARDFNGDISDNDLYIESLSKFLQKEGSVCEVVFEKQPKEKSKALNLLKQFRKDNKDKVSLSIANSSQLEEFKTWLVDSAKMLNFTIANHKDKGFNKYRCETDTDKYVAILNFDDVDFTGQLVKLFDIVKKNSAPL